MAVYQGKGMLLLWVRVMTCTHTHTHRQTHTRTRCMRYRLTGRCAYLTCCSPGPKCVCVCVCVCVFARARVCVCSVKPSLLQHLGTHSALFGRGGSNNTGNSRFHLSKDFRTRVRFPGNGHTHTHTHFPGRQPLWSGFGQMDSYGRA